MYIISVKAFADFDIPYDSELAVIENEVVVKELCSVLNDFCAGLDGCHQDVRLIKYLGDKEWVDKLANELNEKTKIDKSNIGYFIEKLVSVCDSECVYIYPNIFSAKWIMSLN